MLLWSERDVKLFPEGLIYDRILIEAFVPLPLCHCNGYYLARLMLRP